MKRSTKIMKFPKSIQVLQTADTEPLVRFRAQRGDKQFGWRDAKKTTSQNFKNTDDKVPDGVTTQRAGKGG